MVAVPRNLRCWRGLGREVSGVRGCDHSGNRAAARVTQVGSVNERSWWYGYDAVNLANQITSTDPNDPNATLVY